MREQRSAFLGAAALVVCLLAAGAARAAQDPADRCRVAKLTAIAAAASGGLRCHSGAIRRGGPAADPACLQAVAARLASAFQRAERRAGCPPTAAQAQASIEAFVAARAAEVRQTPPPAPTPTPVPGCGNGVTDPGERCDGGPYCDASCAFAFPDLCCSFAPVCVALDDIAGADQCFLSGGTPRVGTRCVSTDPECEPGSPCPGACTPSTFPPTSFCCDTGGSCTASTLSDTEGLAALLMQCGPGAVTEGACVAGSCVPGG